MLFFEAVKLGSVALAVLTFYTAPILLAAFAPMLLPERTSRVALAALPVGAVGIALVALSGDDGSRFSLAAVAAGLGSAATFAALVVVSKRLLADGTLSGDGRVLGLRRRRARALPRASPRR